MKDTRLPLTWNNDVEIVDGAKGHIVLCGSMACCRYWLHHYSAFA